MFEQRIEERREKPVVVDHPEEGWIFEPSRKADGFRCYSLEVLRLLED
jgi:hypothetical protein